MGGVPNTLKAKLCGSSLAFNAVRTTRQNTMRSALLLFNKLESVNQNIPSMRHLHNTHQSTF